MMRPPWVMMYGPPPGWPDGHQQQQVQQDPLVPARIQRAMEFIALMTSKTAPKAAISENSIEVLPIQHLTDEEGTALATACHVLSEYFAGKLHPDAWEMLRVRSAQQHLEQPNVPGRLMCCFACGDNRPSPNCDFCHGSGRIIITSVGTAPDGTLVTPTGDHVEPDADGPPPPGSQPPESTPPEAGEGPPRD